MKFASALTAMLAAGAQAGRLSARLMDSYLQTNPALEFSYEGHVIAEALGQLAAATGNATYTAVRQKILDQLIDVDPASCPVPGLRTFVCNYNSTLYSVDDVSMGMQLRYWYERTGLEKYKYWMDIFRDQLDRSPRNSEGAFWHRSVYPGQQWLDGLYMAEPFYALYTKTYEPRNWTAWADIAHQFDAMEENAPDEATGLLRHGYDASKKAVWADNSTGKSPLVWDRAVGWYIVSLVEVLDVYPVHLPARQRLLKYLRRLAAAVERAQDEASGGYWLIMSEGYAGREKNYIESSATAMFTYAMLKGVRKGYLLDRKKYLASAQKSYACLTDDFIKVNATTGLTYFGGTVSVGSLGSNATFEYYTSMTLRDNDKKGVSAFVWASIEWEKLHGIH